MAAVEQIEAPPEDGRTIDAGDDTPTQALPVSKLPVGQQFDVLKKWWRDDADHSREWRAQTREAFAFRAGEQWTPEDRALLDSQQRPHIVFNRVLTILKAVAGMEINGRHEISFIPRGTEDTKVNEVLTAASKWMSDECDGEDEESQAFDHCCTCGMGWCLSDDAMVRLPNTHFATTRLYSGAVIQISLENGKELTGTPNHPVLTDTGWKRLCDLEEGDNLVNSSFLERIEGFPIQQFDKVETRLKDKIDAFRTGRESLRVVTAPDDFNSDGIGSKVHIVYADSFLLNKIRKTPGFHKINKLAFSWWNLITQFCGSLFPDRYRNSSIYASVCESALYWAHAPFRIFQSTSKATQFIPGGDQFTADGFIGTPEFIANLNGRHSLFKIEPSQFFNRDWKRNGAASPLTHAISGLSQAIGDSSPRYSKFIADFFDWKPLIEIEARKFFCGDIGTLEFLTKVKTRSVRIVNDFAVHDVGTSIGMFIAGNIITSNTENRMSYEENSAGLYVEEAIYPLEMYWDRTAKKKNMADARRVARVRRMPLSDAMGLFPGKSRQQLDAVWADDSLGDYPVRTLEERRKRDSDNSGVQHPYDDACEVTIVNMQWIEKEPYWIVADIQTNSKAELSEAEYKRFSQRMSQLGMPVHGVRMLRKVYKSAFLGGELLKPATSAPIKDSFSWACITGEFDAVKGTWFGLVKVMRDPQMWANKWLSQILHILNTTAKGGILAEEDAFDDQREAENGYARPDTITWVANGSISGNKPKIMPKPGVGISDGYLGLMTFAISSIKDVTGINLELLGQQDQNQPGIIEAMRKQAGMTVLATLFDSLRRFRKQIGRKRLYFIQNFLSDGRLIRVAGPESVQAVPLVRDKTIGEYDVVVDDTPTSPNQKESNWAIIQPLLAVFKDQLMANPQVFAMLLEYSPLPARIVDAIKSFIAQQQNDPQAQQDQELQKKLGVDMIVSEISKNQSIAEMNNAKAGATQATAMYDIAMARNLLAKNDIESLSNHLKSMEVAATANKTAAEVDHTKAKTAREIVGTHLDVQNANAKREEAAANTHGKMVGNIIDHLSATAGARRQIAAAHKDHVIAMKTAATPIPPAGGQGASP